MACFSPNMFSSDNEDEHNEVRDEQCKYADNCDEKLLLDKLNVMLSGIPPPPSLVTCRLNHQDMIEKYKTNEASFILTNNTESLLESTPKVHFLNSGHVSEEIADLLQKIQMRYIHYETLSTCTTWFASSLPITASAKKRQKAWQGTSPGRRLSHLARRRQIFSRANLRQLSQNEPSNHKLEIKPKMDRNHQLASRENKFQQPSLPKRALFQSPEEQTVRPGYRTIIRRFPKHRFENKEKAKEKSVDELPYPPIGSNGGRYDVSGWIATQNFEQGRKRGRELSYDKDVKRRCPRRTLDFSDSSPSRCSQASSNYTSVSQQQISSLHKQKLLWAVSFALKEKSITHKNPNFKSCASALFNICKKNFVTIRNLQIEGGTSEKMLHFARQEVSEVILNNQSKSGVLKDLSESTLNCPRNGNANHFLEGKENKVVLQTPKKKMGVRQWQSCLKSRKKIKKILTRSRSCESFLSEHKLINSDSAILNTSLNFNQADTLCKSTLGSVARKLYDDKNIEDQYNTQNDKKGNESCIRNILNNNSDCSIFHNNSFLVAATPKKEVNLINNCLDNSQVQETPEKNNLENEKEIENYIPGSMEEEACLLFPALCKNTSYFDDSGDHEIDEVDLFDDEMPVGDVSLRNEHFEHFAGFDLDQKRSLEVENKFPLKRKFVFSPDCSLDELMLTATEKSLGNFEPMSQELSNSQVNKMYSSMLDRTDTEVSNIISFQNKTVDLVENKTQKDLISESVLVRSPSFKSCGDSNLGNDEKMSLRTEGNLNDISVGNLSLNTNFSGFEKSDVCNSNVCFENSLNDNNIVSFFQANVAELSLADESAVVYQPKEHISSNERQNLTLESSFSGFNASDLRNCTIPIDDSCNLENESEGPEVLKSPELNGSNKLESNIVGLSAEEMFTSTPLGTAASKLVIKARPAWKIETGPGLRMRVRLSKEWGIDGDFSKDCTASSNAESTDLTMESTRDTYDNESVQPTYSFTTQSLHKSEPSQVSLIGSFLQKNKDSICSDPERESQALILAETKKVQLTSPNLNLVENYCKENITIPSSVNKNYCPSQIMESSIDCMNISVDDDLPLSYLIQSNDVNINRSFLLGVKKSDYCNEAERESISEQLSQEDSFAPNLLNDVPLSEISDFLQKELAKKTYFRKESNQNLAEDNDHNLENDDVSFTSPEKNEVSYSLVKAENVCDDLNLKDPSLIKIKESVSNNKFTSEKSNNANSPPLRSAKKKKKHHLHQMLTEAVQESKESSIATSFQSMLKNNETDFVDENTTSKCKEASGRLLRSAKKKKVSQGMFDVVRTSMSISEKSDVLGNEDHIQAESSINEYKSLNLLSAKKKIDSQSIINAVNLSSDSTSIVEEAPAESSKTSNRENKEVDSSLDDAVPLSFYSAKKTKSNRSLLNSASVSSSSNSIFEEALPDFSNDPNEGNVKIDPPLDDEVPFIPISTKKRKARRSLLNIINVSPSSKPILKEVPSDSMENQSESINENKINGDSSLDDDIPLSVLSAKKKKAILSTLNNEIRSPDSNLIIKEVSAQTPNEAKNKKQDSSWDDDAPLSSVKRKKKVRRSLLFAGNVSSTISNIEGESSVTEKPSRTKKEDVTIGSTSSCHSEMRKEDCQSIINSISICCGEDTEEVLGPRNENFGNQIENAVDHDAKNKSFLPIEKGKDGNVMSLEHEDREDNHYVSDKADSKVRQSIEKVDNKNYSTRQEKKKKRVSRLLLNATGNASCSKSTDSVHALKGNTVNSIAGMSNVDLSPGLKQSNNEELLNSPELDNTSLEDNVPLIKLVLTLEESKKRNQSACSFPYTSEEPSISSNRLEEAVTLKSNDGITELGASLNYNINSKVEGCDKTELENSLSTCKNMEDVCELNYSSSFGDNVPLIELTSSKLNPSKFLAENHAESISNQSIDAEESAPNDLRPPPRALHCEITPLKKAKTKESSYLESAIQGEKVDKEEWTESHNQSKNPYNSLEVTPLSNFSESITSSNEKRLSTHTGKRRLSLESYKARQKLETCSDDCDSTEKKKIYMIRLKHKLRSSGKKRKRKHLRTQSFEVCSESDMNSDNSLTPDSCKLRDPRKKLIYSQDKNKVLPDADERIYKSYSHDDDQMKKNMSKYCEERVTIIRNSVSKIKFAIQQEVKQRTKLNSSKAKSTDLDELYRIEQECSLLIQNLEKNPELMLNFEGFSNALQET